MTADGRHVEVKKGRDGQFYPLLKAGNNEVVMSGEGYTRESDAWRGARAAFPDLFDDEAEQ